MEYECSYSFSRHIILFFIDVCAELDYNEEPQIFFGLKRPEKLKKKISFPFYLLIIIIILFFFFLWKQVLSTISIIYVNLHFEMTIVITPPLEPCVVVASIRVLYYIGCSVHTLHTTSTSRHLCPKRIRIFVLFFSGNDLSFFSIAIITQYSCSCACEGLHHRHHCHWNCRLFFLYSLKFRLYIVFYIVSHPSL